MNGWEIATLVLYGLLIAEQTGAVVIFAVGCYIGSRRRSEDFFPKTLVILALRGADSSLPDCLRALFQQHYPNYRVRVVLDSWEDPACAVVQQVLAETAAEHVDVQVLQEPLATCSLKCSAVHQATTDLSDGCEVVATIDSDIVPHPNWLRELVAPLADSRVGAAMGNRWYAPPRGQWGSWICYAWNAAAVVSMYINKVPWGGSLATKASILRSSDLRQRWTRAGCEDVPLFGVLRKLRLRLAFVPSLLMVDRDETDVPGCMRFITRQMLWARLYHPACWWPSVVLYWSIALLLVASVGLALAAALQQRWVVAGLLLLGMAAYFATEAILVTSLEMLVRRLLAKRREPGCRLGWRTYAGVFIAHVLSPLMIWRALVLRRFTWRGIDYEVRGPWKIRMVQYRPYVATGVAEPGAAIVNDSSAADSFR